jgi:hypothetical protein
MMEIDIVPTLLSKIRDSKNSIELFLANGGAKSYEEYCRCVGEYAALGKIEDDIKDVEQRFIES